MKLRTLVMGVAVAALALSPAMAAKKAPPVKCAKDKVLTALQMRMLQTELVVGALSCKMTPRYNDFVKAYQTDLMGAHKQLMKFFGRESVLEDYKSKGANEVSQRSLANITEFCANAASLYDQLLGPEKVQLANFVATEPSANRHGIEVCGAPATIEASAVPANPNRRVPKPRVKPDVQVAAAPKPADAPAAAPPAAAATP